MEQKKCYKCNKKIKSLLPLKCKCDKYFCNKHKYGDEHECSFNYLLNNQEKLKNDNLQIIKNKVEKI